MVTGSLDTTIKIWNPKTFELLNSIDGHTHMINRIIELKNGKLVSCSLDKTVNIWDRHTGDILYTLEGFDETILDI